jgi:hypothetical protein
MDTPFSPSSFYCDADDAFLKLDLAKFMDVMGIFRFLMKMMKLIFS